MKKYPRHLVILTGLFILLSGSSCTTEIDLYPDNTKEELFVWACLDGSGKLHQAKIRKFLRGEIDGYEMANDPEYYLPSDSIQVWLSGDNFSRVDFKPVLYPPQEGLIHQSKNIIYEIADLPVQSVPTKLLIYNPVNNDTIFGSVNGIAQVHFTFPASVGPNTQFDFTISYYPFHINWSGSALNIWGIRIKYLDILNTGDTLFQAPTYYGAMTGGSERKFPLDFLWKIFTASIPVDPKVDFRKFYRFDFLVFTASSELEKYLNIAHGFTDDRRNKFFNITNGNGVLYSTNYAILKNLRPKDAFGSRLVFSDSVSHLKFVSQIYEGTFIDPDSTIHNPFVTLNLQKP